jgi:hypothetical protein
VDRHLVTVEIGVKRRADERVDPYRVSFDKMRLERLYAKTVERGRALLAIAYVQLIRSLQSGSYEREHNKIADVLSSAEVALEAGKKRIARLRNARSEIVMQFAGVIGILVTALAIAGYAIYTIIANEPPT